MPRRNQTNTNSVINEEGNEPKRNLITFNYSESLNRIIELNTENYKGWSRKILYLLSINKLTKYVMKQEIKKFRKKTFTGNLSNYIPDRLDDLYVYQKGTTSEDIENDNTAKWIIINSLSDKTAKLVEGDEKTSYNVWEILKASFTKRAERRKLEIEQQIKELKYNVNDDISIFIANLQNLINDLEDIDGTLSDTSKIGILNRCLPPDLRWINVFQFDDWNKCATYVKLVSQKSFFQT